MIKVDAINLVSLKFEGIINQKEIVMKRAIKVAILAAVVATLTGCTGSVYNKEKNCDYDYLLHPAISVSKIIGGCGPVAK